MQTRTIIGIGLIIAFAGLGVYMLQHPVPNIFLTQSALSASGQSCSDTIQANPFGGRVAKPMLPIPARVIS